MSRIDDLIRQCAPSGIPRRPLGEVGTFIRGRRFTKDDMVDVGIPSIHYGGSSDLSVVEVGAAGVRGGQRG